MRSMKVKMVMGVMASSIRRSREGGCMGDWRDPDVRRGALSGKVYL